MDYDETCACVDTLRGTDTSLCPLHSLAEAQGRQHAAYHAEASRLAATADAPRADR